jgi:hypothetical protein
MRNAIIVTNMWSSPRDPEEEFRETQLKTEFFRTAINHGARIARRGGIGPESASAIVRLFFNCSPVELQIQNELAVQRLALDETEAGALVDQNLRVRLQRQEHERMELEKELSAAYEERDRRAQEQLERFRREKEEESRLLRQQLEMLRSARQQMFPAYPQAQPPTSTAQQPLPSQPTQPSHRSFSWGWRRGQTEAHRRQHGGPQRSAAPITDGMPRAERALQGSSVIAAPKTRRPGLRLIGRFRIVYRRRTRRE